MKKFLKIGTAMALAVVLGVVPGCSKGEVTSGTTSGITTPAGQYPVKSNKKLTYWVNFTGQSSSGVKNFSELPFFKALKEKTGIEVEYIHPVAGQDTEQFNLLLASGEYPDIIERDFYSFRGGPDKAIKDGYIIKLNDAIDKWAPNLKAYLKANPEIDKSVQTDSGSYYCFPFLRGDESLIVFMGPIIRQDLLDKVGLGVPQTIDEWETVLRAFKAAGVETPLSIINYHLGRSQAFVGAFGVKQGIYVKDGKIKYGECEPGYKDFLTKMNQWYRERLLDQNFASIDNKTLEGNMIAGRIGATVGNTISGIGTWEPAGKTKNPDYKLSPAPYPVLKKGDKVEFSQWDLPYSTFGSPTITTQCSDVELAARLLDFGYSKEGALMSNFGTEGVSYNMVNGQPVYTDLIMKNPEGKTASAMRALYTRPNGNGPFIQDPRYMDQMAIMPAQKESLKIWADTNTANTYMPKITLTDGESQEAAIIQGNLTTYISEMTYKYIMGVEPLSNYDKFLQQIKDLKVERYIEINQAAYDRYMKR